MGKICYDCATEKINGVCPNCYPNDVKSPEMDKKINMINYIYDTIKDHPYPENLAWGIKEVKVLLSYIEELEERTAEAEWSGGWAIDPNFYVEKTKLDDAENRIKELEEGQS